MQSPDLLAFVLADQSIHDVERHAISERRKRVELGQGLGKPGGVAFKAQAVVYAAHGKAVEISGNAHGVVIEQR